MSATAPRPLASDQALHLRAAPSLGAGTQVGGGRTMRTWRAAWPPVALVVIGLVIWQFVASSRHIRPQILPTPWLVATQGWDDRSVLWANTVPTLEETALGFAVSVACGWIFAIAMELSGLVRRALYPVLVASQTLPLIAIAPLVDLWLGFGLAPKLVVVAIVTFFPITVGLTEGFESAEREGVNLILSMGASKLTVFRRLKLPGAMPHFFAGLRIAITYAVVGAVFSEYVGANEGLGIFMSEQANQLRTDLVYAAVAVTAGVSIGLFALTFLVQRLAIPWYARSRRASGAAR